MREKIQEMRQESGGVWNGAVISSVNENLSTNVAVLNVRLISSK